MGRDYIVPHASIQNSFQYDTTKRNEFPLTIEAKHNKSVVFPSFPSVAGYIIVMLVVSPYKHYVCVCEYNASMIWGAGNTHIVVLALTLSSRFIQLDDNVMLFYPIDVVLLLPLFTAHLLCSLLQSCRCRSCRGKPLRLPHVWFAIAQTMSLLEARCVCMYGHHLI